MCEQVDNTKMQTEKYKIVPPVHTNNIENSIEKKTKFSHPTCAC